MPTLDSPHMPADIITEVNSALSAQDKTNLWEGIDKLVDDLMNSVHLAISTALGDDFSRTRADIINTVYDYYGNHYAYASEEG